VAENEEVTWLRRLPAVLAALVFGVGVGNVAMTLTAPAARAEALIATTSPATTAAPLPAPAAPVLTTTTVAPTTTTTATPAPTTTTTTAPVELAAAPAPKAAPTPTPAATTPQERGAQALELIGHPWERLGYSVTFEGPDPGLLGKADCNTNEIWVYVRPSQTIRQIAFVTAFELGHAVDCGFMTDEERSEWASIRGFAPGWTWFPSCVCSEDDFGSGDISMVFATWLVPDGGYGWRSNLAPQPDAAQLEQLMPYLVP
jgi:hypothetical protein